MEIPGSSNCSTLQESSISDESPDHSCGQGSQSIGLVSIPTKALA